MVWFLPPPAPVELVVGIMAMYHSVWWWLPLLVLITARIIAFVVYGIWWSSLKLLYFAWVSMHSLWSCGCIDCFCSASFDFQDIWPSDGYPSGNFEKLRNKHGCGPPNFGPYHPTRGGSARHCSCLFCFMFAGLHLDVFCKLDAIRYQVANLIYCSILTTPRTHHEQVQNGNIDLRPTDAFVQTAVAVL